MEFIITEYKHCDLIEINGRLDSYSAPKIEEALNALIIDNHNNFIIDLRNVTFISSSGILVFVTIQKRFLRQNRGKIVLCEVPEKIFSNFKLAGFDRIFDFYSDVVSAVGSF